MSSFSDRLTPKQIQQVLDALKLPWREYYNPDNDGWVNISSYELPNQKFNSDLSVNIQNGGFVDQYSAGHPEPLLDGIPIRGDLITLVAWLNWEDANATSKAIEWVKDVLGMGNGVKPPELKDGRLFVNDWLNSVDGYTRVPDSVLHCSLSTSAKLVWIEIFSRINKGQVYSFAGIRDIGDRIGVSTTTIQRALKELEQAGLLIQKKAPTGQRVNKYPLVAKKEQINRALKSDEESETDTIRQAKEQHQSKAVSNMDTAVSNMNGLPCQKPIQNKTHSNKTQKNKTPNSYKSKTEVVAHSGYLFLSEEQEEAFHSVLAQIGIEDIPQPPTSYSNLFRDTFMVAPYGINQFTGEVFDKRGYPRSWDNISEGYYPKSKSITAVA